MRVSPHETGIRLTLLWIWKYPLGRCHRLGAYGRYMWFRSLCCLTLELYAMARVTDTALLLEPAMRCTTGNLCCGLCRWPDLPLVLHLLDERV